jgi:hypothetical protein
MIFIKSQTLTRAASLLIVGAITAMPSAKGQTLAPVSPFAAQSLRIKRLPDGKRRLFLPLLGATPDEVEAFYTTSNWLAPLQQVRFLYGFGQGSKSLSVDLASMEFPFGVQTTFGSSVTAPAETPAADTTQTGVDSVTQGLERLKAGGDFYVRNSYPIFAAENEAKTNMFTIFSISTLGLNISGFGDETTLTESTEHNFNSSIEAYGQYGAIGGKGYLYADYRGGLQTVQTDFARSAGLAHKNFGLGQLAVGLQFAGFMRIGFERFFGPPAAFATTKDELSKWHLVLQIMPLQK